MQAHCDDAILKVNKFSSLRKIEKAQFIKKVSAKCETQEFLYAFACMNEVLLHFKKITRVLRRIKAKLYFKLSLDRIM